MWEKNIVVWVVDAILNVFMVMHKTTLTVSLK